MVLAEMGGKFHTPLLLFVILLCHTPLLLVVTLLCRSANLPLDETSIVWEEVQQHETHLEEAYRDKEHFAQELLEKAELTVCLFPEKAPLVGWRILDDMRFDAEQHEQPDGGRPESFLDIVRIRDVIRLYVEERGQPKEWQDESFWDRLYHFCSRSVLVPHYSDLLWGMLLSSFLFGRMIPEKPSKHRPPCTTMPWDIRTALAVLWGVCWMFYPWSPVENLRLRPRSGGEKSYLESYFDHEFFGHSQPHHPVASNEPSWDFPIGDLPVWDLQSWDSSGRTGYGNLQGPHPDPFAPSSVPETRSTSSYGVAPLQTTLAAPAPFSFPGKQVHDSDSGSYRVEPVLGYFSEAPSGGTADQLAVSLPGTTIKTFEGAGLTFSIDQQAISIADGDPRKGHAQLPAQSAREAAGRMERAAHIPPKLTTYKRSEEPPQNAEGKIICKYNECSNRTFTRRCDWNKHMDKHERPYICTVDSCEHSKGFTSKGDLLRHQRIVHKSDSEQETLLFCEEPNCARGPLGGPTAAFSRPDNLAQHIRTTHGQSSTNSSAGRRRIEDASSTISPEVRSESPRRMDDEPATSLQRKRRRTSETGLSSRHADDEEGEAVGLRRELKNAMRRVDELTEELKETQKRHEKKTETLVGIIERLTQQSK